MSTIRYLTAKVAQEVSGTGHIVGMSCAQHLPNVPWIQIDEELMSLAGAFSLDQVSVYRELFLECP